MIRADTITFTPPIITPYTTSHWCLNFYHHYFNIGTPATSVVVAIFSTTVDTFNNELEPTLVALVVAK